MLLKKIQALCSENQTTITKLERDCGLANATIRRWSCASPNVENLGKVADYFNVSVDYLLGRSAHGLSEDAVKYAKLFDALPNKKKRLAIAYMGIVQEQ